MSINWNRYLARYQQARGGIYFGGEDTYYDSQLVLTEGERSPLLVWFDSAPSGRCTSYNLRARTMVELNGTYHLHIRESSLVGKGVVGVMGMMGKLEYGCPEATAGRIITTDNKEFTKKVLGDLDLRSSLQRRKKDYLKITPGPQQDGWHLVEVGAINFEGMMGGSDWINDAMVRDISLCRAEEVEGILKAGSAHFNAQMDGFLDFLRAARQAVTAWRM